jgi:iron complex transport system ATP-binding protein
MSTSLLQFEDIAFSYEAGVPLLSEIGISAARGQAVALLGPNGVGKTTLLRIALGWLRPSRGRVLVAGRDVAHYHRRELGRRLALVPQDERLPFDYSLHEYALLGRTPHLRSLDVPSAEDRRVAEEALATVGLSGIAERSVAVLSAGERQLLLLARALAQAPQALLLDEPSSHLDIGNKSRLFGLLRGLRESGHTLLFTTHDPQFAMNLADTVVVLKEGGIMAMGTPVETLRSDVLSAVFEAPIEVLETSYGPAVFWS